MSGERDSRAVRLGAQTSVGCVNSTYLFGVLAVRSKSLPVIFCLFLLFFFPMEVKVEVSECSNPL